MNVDHILKKIYNDEGNFLGRNGLFYIVKKRVPKSHPSKNQIEGWLKRQEVAQLPNLSKRTTFTKK